jgi:hypothetical protein
MGVGEPEDSASSEGKLAYSSEPTKYLCRQVEGRAQFRGRGFGLSTITTN